MYDKNDWRISPFPSSIVDNARERFLLLFPEEADVYYQEHTADIKFEGDMFFKYPKLIFSGRSGRLVTYFIPGDNQTTQVYNHHVCTSSIAGTPN